MSIVELIGTSAGTMTTIAFIPQVVKTWRTQSAQDISLFTFMLFSAGVLLWMVYGIAIGAMPVIVANAVTLVLALSILVLKIRDMYRERMRRWAANQRSL